MTKASTTAVEVVVNGTRFTKTVPDRKLLCDFLREDLNLTGTHVGCEQGVCGACTILLNGSPVRSCLMLAVQADGSSITTIEGVCEPDGALNPIQRAFHEEHALQCGFCTPGLIMTTIAYLEERGQKAGPLSEDEVREHLSGSICRCTGYTNIVRAVRRASNALGKAHSEGGAL
jgi:aerobic-type carbon monoxide dehydrogenase small subunit (CoxS/CutS family)